MSALDTTRTTLVLAGTVALAVAAALPRVRHLESRIGLSVFSASGLPFLLLGVVYANVGVLSEPLINDLRPAWVLGLGWIGFLVGARLQMTRFERLPNSLLSVTGAVTLVPMIVVGLSVAGVLWTLQVSMPVFTRELWVVAACAAASALPGSGRDSLLGSAVVLGEVVSLAALGAITIFLRPDADFTQWILPRSGWALLLLGLGTMLGVLTWMFVRSAKNEAEEIAFLLGSVALAAGIAGHLALSIPVVCAIAGAVLVNLPLRDVDGLRGVLRDVERPLYLVFLVVLGASWNVSHWQGWLLAAIYVVARAVGKLTGTMIASIIEPFHLPRWQTMFPVLLSSSPMAIAVIAAATTQGDVAAGDWAITAVIAGSLATDALARGLMWGEKR